MDRKQLESTFDGQAATYDQQWSKLASFRDGMHLLLTVVFSELPDDARMLCVGTGTGAEIHALAERFPGWRFVAVEPSAGMVAAARQRAQAHGYAARCIFHTGYLDTLPDSGAFDCASALMVSQFILDRTERTGFFADIARRLRPDGILASADLAADVRAPGYSELLAVWMRTLAAADLSPERMAQMREAYDRDVAILPPQDLEALIASAGFEPPTRFFQAGLIHAFYARRAA
ncbi:MAG: class I SAM-dependent methyltransferase [Xanthomonadales bacterium]|nr:class I SAM-dependent methyltransferase [Xanthomonadales bacterium]